MIHLVKYAKEGSKLSIANTISRANFTVEQVDVFRPKKVLAYKDDSFLIKNLNSVVRFKFSARTQQAVFLDRLRIPGAEAKGFDWELATTASGSIIVARTSNETEPIV